VVPVPGLVVPAGGLVAVWAGGAAPPFVAVAAAVTVGAELGLVLVLVVVVEVVE
jgi:hypothetical protein